MSARPARPERLRRPPMPPPKRRSGLKRRLLTAALWKDAPREEANCVTRAVTLLVVNRDRRI